MKKFLAIFLTTLLLVIPMVTIVASATSYNQESNEKKITDELKAEMENKKNNEYISIYIWLYDLGDDVVYSRLSNKLGKKISKDNEELYIDEKVKNKVEKYREKQKTKNSKNEKFDVSVFREEAEISEILTNEEIEKCIDSGKTTEQVIELSEKYEFLSEYRKSRAYINQSVNEIFENKINKSKCKNINIDSALPYVRMECKKSYISKILNFSMVREIGVYSEKTIENTDEINTNTTDSTDRYDMNEYANLAYNTYGIKIGVIEKGETFDISNPHLVNKNIVIVSGSTTQNDVQINHSTKVLSILCGNEINGFSGVATGATIYFAGGLTEIEDIKNHLKTLVLEKEVSVVNLSFTINNNNYNELAQYIDCFIEQYRTIIVSAVGNNGGYVQNPALSFNSISVGNISNLEDDIGYVVSATSSYGESYTYCAEKPDISAFGTNMHMYSKDESGNIVLTNYGSGTSFATPIVTGTVALMLSANSKLIGNPDVVKTIIMNSADSSAISSDGNETVCVPNTSGVVATSQLKEKSGAGLVNVVGAINMAMSNVLYRYCISGTSTTNEASRVIGEFYFEKNENIEFTLVFEKHYHNIPSNLSNLKTDFDIEIYDSDGNKILWTRVAQKNNVECIKMISPENDYYRFELVCKKLNTDTGTISESPHSSHNNIYVSFLISCGCDLPSVEIEENSETQSGHQLICDNCNTTFFEKHDYESVTQHFDGVDVTYGVYYKVHPFWVDENYPAFFCINRENLTPTVEATASGNLATAILNSSHVEYQNEKYWELLSYEIIVFTPTYDVVASYISTLYVNIYYATGECNFEPSV